MGEKLIKDYNVKIEPFEFESFTTFKDISIKFYKEYVDISFIFDLEEEVEVEDDILGSKMKTSKLSTNDTVALFKDSLAEASVIKETVTGPDEEDNYIWTTSLIYVGGNIKIRCTSKAEAFHIRELFINWKLNKEDFE